MSENTAAEQVIEMPKHGEFCWTEFATDNLEASRNFYTEVFGWQFKQSQATGDEMQYLEASLDGQNTFGAVFEMQPEWYGGTAPAPHSNIYVAVDDADATAEKALKLGGKLLSQPTDMPNVGRFCEIEDPTGAKFFIIKLQ